MNPVSIERHLQRPRIGNTACVRYIQRQTSHRTGPAQTDYPALPWHDPSWFCSDQWRDAFEAISHVVIHMSRLEHLHNSTIRAPSRRHAAYEASLNEPHALASASPIRLYLTSDLTVTFRYIHEHVCSTSTCTVCSRCFCSESSPSNSILSYSQKPYQSYFHLFQQIPFYHTNIQDAFRPQDKRYQLPDGPICGPPI
jgi:hypothetical protein